MSTLAEDYDAAIEASYKHDYVLPSTREKGDALIRNVRERIVALEQQNERLRNEAELQLARLYSGPNMIEATVGIPQTRVQIMCKWANG